MLDELLEVWVAARLALGVGDGAIEVRDGGEHACVEDREPAGDRGHAGLRGPSQTRDEVTPRVGIALERESLAALGRRSA